MSHSPLQFFAHLYTGPHGISGQPQWWGTSRLTCLECGLPVPKEKGIVCANSTFQRQHWKPCQSAWHADCYGIKNSHVEYPIHKLENEDDGLIDDEDIEEEASRFLHARDGDHLMCPFQCDLCHFRNIQKRDPGPDPRDAYAMMAIRRAILDSFWSRESSTVLANQ